MRSTGGTILSEKSSPASTAIAELIGEKTNVLDISDIIILSKSRDFLSLIARKLLDRSDFNSLIFTPIHSKKIKNSKIQFQDCNRNKECITKKLSYILESFISIKGNNVIDNFFSVETKTLHKKTASAILQAVKEGMLEMRINILSTTIRQQKDVINKVIFEKNSLLKDVSVEGINREQEQKISDKKLLEGKITNLEHELQKQKVTLELAQSKLEQTKNILKRKRVNTKDIDLVEKIANLSTDIRNLKRDIQALELSQGSLGVADKQILNQLKANLSAKERKLRSIKSQSKLTYTDTKFLTKKDVSSKDLNFEFKVAKSQVAKTIQRLTLLKDNRARMQIEIKENSKKIDEYSPVFEQIKLLKNKLSHLSLLASTITPDIKFDDEISPVRSFKRTTKVKVIIYSAFLTLFFIFIIITIRYLIDPRIYDEEELAKNFQDLDVIGQTPDFK